MSVIAIVAMLCYIIIGYYGFGIYEKKYRGGKNVIEMQTAFVATTIVWIIFSILFVLGEGYRGMIADLLIGVLDFLGTIIIPLICVAEDYFSRWVFHQIECWQMKHQIG